MLGICNLFEEGKGVLCLEPGNAYFDSLWSAYLQ